MDVVTLKLNQSVIFYKQSQESQKLLKLLESPEFFIKNGDTHVLKVGSRTIVRTMLDQQAIVVKRYNIKRISHFLRRCLFPTRALSTWRVAERLTKLNIPIAFPIAVIENRYFGLRGRSYYITEYVKGEHIGQFFHKADLSDPTVQSIARKLVTTIEKLAKLKIIHGDLKMTNILICNGEPVFIDLDGVRQFKFRFKFWRSFKNEQKRFLKNWEMRPAIHEFFAQLFQEMNERLKHVNSVNLYDGGEPFCFKDK